MHPKFDDDKLWPEGLLCGAEPLISKGEGPDPMKQRVLTVLSPLYRMWSGAMYRELQSWQEGWIDDSLRGGRDGNEPLDANFEVTMDVEEALLDRVEMQIASLDYSKYVDRFTWDLTWEMLEEMGGQAAHGYAEGLLHEA